MLGRLPGSFYSVLPTALESLPSAWSPLDLLSSLIALGTSGLKAPLVLRGSGKAGPDVASSYAGVVSLDISNFNFLGKLQ